MRLKDLSLVIQQNWMLLLGLVFFWIWQLSFFQGPSFVLAKPSTLPGILPAILPFLLANGATYLVCSARWQVVHALFRKSGFDFACMTVTAAGTALIVIPPLVPFGTALFQTLLYLLGSVSMGAGAAMFNLKLGFAIARIRQRLVPYISVIPIVISSIALAGLLQAPAAVQAVLLIGSALAFTLLIRGTRRSSKTRNYYGLGTGSCPKPPKRYFVTALMHGLSMGVLFSILALSHGAGIGPLVQPLSFLVGAMLMVATVFHVRMDYNMLLYRVGIPILALGLAMLGLVPEAAFAGTAVYLVGYSFVNVIMMCLNMYFIVGLRFSPVYIVGYSTLFLAGGQLAGTIVAVPVSVGPDPSAMLALLGCGTAFTLLVGALYCQDGKNMLSGWGSVKIAETPIERSRDESKQLLAAKYGLSKRETEIFNFLTQGRSRKNIADTLCLSEETIKTYTGNLYKKLGVSSKQEVIDLLDTVR